MSSSNAALLARRQAAVARGINQAHPVFVAHAHNDLIRDVDGNEYIDFTSGIAALNVGHLHPAVVEAVQHQLRQFTHTCFAALPYEPYVAVCERINRLMPGGGDCRSALVTTGAEAVESALKIARVRTQRRGLIAFTGAFHGRTFMTMALNGKVAPYASKMGLMPGDVYRAPFPAGTYGVDVDMAMQGIERIFHNDAAPEDIAAIVFEPVQGEGGIHVAPAAFVAALRALCNRHGIVLIADEVQSGAGRTGTFFACEQLDVVPDVIVFGKSVAGGLPLAGLVGQAEIVDAVGPGGLGGTYAGNPLACAAALAVLDVMERERLLERAREIGATMRTALHAMQRRHASVAEVRGLGALIGVELRDADGRPATDRAKRLLASARERGLLLLAGGVHGNVLRLLPPLSISNERLQAALAILDECLAAFG